MLGLSVNNKPIFNKKAIISIKRHVLFLRILFACCEILLIRNSPCTFFNSSSWIDNSKTFPWIVLQNSNGERWSNSLPFFIRMTSLAICSISDTTCVANKTIFSLAILEIIFLIRIRSLGSSPAVGSSKMMILGWFMIAWAIRILCFIPPEYCPKRRCASSCKFTIFKTFSISILAVLASIPFKAAI